MAMTHWTCRRQKANRVCGHRNTGRKQKCAACGGRRPARREPKHMTALEITYQEYIDLQGGEHCGICGKGPTRRKLDRDHDHHTSAPRGLLCNRCNRALPAWVTADWLEKAALYIVTARERNETAK